MFSDINERYQVMSQDGLSLLNVLRDISDRLDRIEKLINTFSGEDEKYQAKTCLQESSSTNLKTRLFKF